MQIASELETSVVRQATCFQSEVTMDAPDGRADSGPLAFLAVHLDLADTGTSLT